MVKKKEVEQKSSCCNWTGKEWLGVVISESALYLFFWYTLSLLGSVGNLWVSSLVLLVLLNVSLYACPVVRKHYL
jgi:hypothetical protein